MLIEERKKTEDNQLAYQEKQMMIEENQMIVEEIKR